MMQDSIDYVQERRLCQELKTCSDKLKDKGSSLWWYIESGKAHEKIPQIIDAIKNDTINYYETDFYGRNALHLALKNPLLEPIAVALINKDARLLLQPDDSGLCPVSFAVTGDQIEVLHLLRVQAEIQWKKNEKTRLPIPIKKLTYDALEALSNGEEYSDGNPLNEVYHSSYFSVSAAESHTEDKPLYIIKNKRGKVIADDVVSYEYYSCNNYYDLIHIKHQDNTQSVFDKNGKPLKDAYRAAKLTMFGTKKLGHFRYHVSEQGAISGFHRVYPWKRYMRKLTKIAAITLPAALVVGVGLKSIQKKTEEIRQENQQNATLIKMDGPVALFDVDGDKKPDYVGKSLDAAGQVFLSENVGQTKKIGSWKEAKGVSFKKYNSQSQHERQ